jgi:hypothetical protein
MRRFSAAGLLLPAALATGCLDPEIERSVRRVFSPAEIPQTREAPLAEAARVDQVGRQILAANPFCASDVGFQAVGADVPAIFHRDPFNVFVTDKLVNQCKSDAELAAVLCSELGAMVAERRNATRMGIPEPIYDVPTVNNSMEAGGIPPDQLRLAELGMLEKRIPKKSAERLKDEVTDPRKIAVDLYKSAGYDEKDYDRAEPIMRAVSKDSPIVRQLNGPPLLPSWTW